MIVKKAIGSLALVLATGAAVFAPAPAAQAADSVITITTSAGVMKARAALNDADNEFCMRVYNSGATAYARLRVFNLGGALLYARTNVRQSDGRVCFPQSSVHEGLSFRWELVWFGANGSVIGATEVGSF